MNGINSDGHWRDFGGSKPDLLASRRHTIRFVLIVCGIALLGFLQSHRPALSPGGSNVPLYLSIMALQLLFLWFVRLGIRVQGHSLLRLFGKRWQSPLDGLRDVMLAILFVVVLEAV